MLFLRTPMQRTLPFLVVALSLLAPLSGASAPNNAPPARGEIARPEVLVLVLSGVAPTDSVSISYDRVVPAADARGDVAELKRITGWPVQGEEITNKKATAPGARLTTSAQFQAPQLANAAQGTLPLEPFITTLKRHKTMQIIFLVPASGFVFHGLEDFENENVKIHLKQSAGSYTYHVTVKNSDFDRLQLPLTQEQQVKAPQAATPTGARILVVFGVAIVGGILAYLIAFFLGRRRASG